MGPIWRTCLLSAALAALAGTTFAQQSATKPAATATRPATAAATAPATAPAIQKAAIPKALVDRMDQWIALLQAGKNRELIESMLSPDELDQARQRGLDELAASFSGESAALLLGELMRAKQAAPAINGEATRVEFPHAPGQDIPTLAFKKIGDTWYLDGH
jgi:hypothetical protein